MKIALIGAGVMGSIVGALCQRSGADVVLIDPFKEHMDKIRTEGLKIINSYTGETETEKIRTVYSAEGLDPVDLVIVLVKGPLTHTAVKAAKNIIGEDTMVATFQNGVGNEIILSEVVPKEKVLFGLIRFAAKLIEPGTVSASLSSDDSPLIYIGALVSEEKQVAFAKRLADMFSLSGFQMEYSDNIQQQIWNKATNNIPCNALCGILRLTVDMMYNHPDGKAVMHGILREMTEIGSSLGLQMDYDFLLKQFEANLPVGHYPSLAQDVMNKKLTEVEALNGAMCRYGEELGIDTPYNRIIAHLIRCIQDNYENQF